MGNSNLQSIVVANTDKGFETDTGLTGTGNVFRNIVSTNNTTYGFDMYNASFGTIPGYVIYGNNGTADCSANPFDMCVSASAVNSASITSALIGKVTSDDTLNTSDTSGTASTITTLSGLLYFDKWLRGWGKDGSSFPNSDHRGYASAATYRIWDWRVNATSNILYNKSEDGSTANDTFTPSSACPSAVDGNLYATHNSKTFLINAIEIDNDQIGNDNGLCESNESCIYAPNIGAFQGEGALTSSCTFSPGTVTGVSMYAHTTLGI